MKYIAVIGAGQLGSRHLQALALCTFPVTLYVVDSNKESLAIAKERFEEIKPNACIKEIKFFLSIESLKKDIDFCVIATGANVRLSVLQALAERVNIKHLLLEKVLFQAIAEYHAAREIIEGHNIKAWVNCPRRMYSFYQELKALLSTDPKIFYRVYGGEWGLGCNAIHFIDHMAFLTDSVITSMDISRIDNIIRESKRPGFVEFTGSLRVSFDNGSEMELVSVFGSEEPVKLSIDTHAYEIFVSESEGKAVIKDKMSRKKNSVVFELPYQSSLTNLVAEDILLKGKCQLTGFDESMSLHLPLIESLLKHMNLVVNKETNTLPIT